MSTEISTLIRWRTFLLCAAATVAAFAKTVSFPFVNWQDPSRILDPASSKLFGAASAWRTFTDLSAAPYQPVTDLFNALNAYISGADPAAFHAVNVALHAAAALLVYVYLSHWRIDHVPAVIGALVFALHPLRVEAVAWASGRSELLATLGVLVSALSFIHYRSSGRGRWYFLSFAAAVAGAGSSISAAPWPFFLLWLERSAPGRTSKQWLAELAPFLVLGLASIAGGGVPWFENALRHGLPEAVFINAAAFPASVLLFFIWQTTAPSGLSVVYTLPALGPWWWLVLAVLAVAVWFLVRGLRGRELYLVGVAWVLLFLLPSAFGLHEGPGPVNDRSTMLPSVGVALIVSALAQTLMMQQQGRFARLVKLSAVLVLAFLGTLASIQSETWSTSTALWTAAAERSPTSALVHNYLGAALAHESGDLARAEHSFSIALHHEPMLAAAYANRGATRAALGREEEGLRDLNEALRLERNNGATRMLRASILRRVGRRAEALRDMHLALAHHPMNIAWMVERVELLLEMGRTGEASAELEVMRRAGYDVNVERR